MHRQPRNPFRRTVITVAILAVVLVAALFFLSSSADEVPTRQIEVDVAPTGNAG